MTSQTQPRSEDRTLAAIEATAEWSKQLVAIASGYIPVSVALFELLNVRDLGKVLILCSLVIMSLSILIGILFLGSVVHHIHSSSGDEFVSRSGNVLAVGQFALFFMAILLFVGFAFQTLLDDDRPSDAQTDESVTSSATPEDTSR